MIKPSLKQSCIVLALALLFVMPAPGPAATGDPLPGVDILVRKKPGDKPKLHFGSADLPAIPADFFNPGSEPFTGTVVLEGPCGDNPAPCADSQLNYLEGPTPNVLDVEILPLELMATAPIEIQTAGDPPDNYCIVVVMDPEGLPPGEPVVRTVELPPESVLLPGSVTHVVESNLSMMVTLLFIDDATGNPAGSLAFPMQLQMTSVDPPISRLLDAGSPVVLGYDGVDNDGIGYLSSGGGMEWYMESNLPESPVATRLETWGAIKKLMQ